MNGKARPLGKIEKGRPFPFTLYNLQLIWVDADDRAWEALRIVMREEEAARGTAAGTTVEGADSGASNDPIGMGGDDEYRLREESR